MWSWGCCFFNFAWCIPVSNPALRWSFSILFHGMTHSQLYVIRMQRRVLLCATQDFCKLHRDVLRYVVQQCVGRFSILHVCMYPWQRGFLKKATNPYFLRVLIRVDALQIQFCVNGDGQLSLCAKQVSSISCVPWRAWTEKHFHHTWNTPSI